MVIRKKNKIKLPKIQFAKSGRKYVIIGNKKILFDKDVSNNQLIKFIIQRLTQKKKRAKKSIIVDDKKSKLNLPVAPTKNLGISSGVNPSNAVKSQRELDEAKKAAEDAKLEKQKAEQDLKKLKEAEFSDGIRLIKDQKDEYDDLLKQKEQLKKDVRDIRVMLAQAEKNKAFADAEIKRLGEAIDALNKQQQETLTELGKKAKELQDVTDQKNAVDAENKQLEGEKVKLTEQKTILETERNTLAAEKARLEAEKTGLENDIKQAESVIDQLNEELSKATNVIDKDANRIDALKRMLTAAEKKKEAYVEAYYNLEQDLAKQTAENTRIANEIAAVNTQLGNLQNEKQQLEQQLEQTRKQVEGEIKALREEKEKADAELNVIKEQLQKIKDDEKAQEDKIDEIKNDELIKAFRGIVVNSKTGDFLKEVRNKYNIKTRNMGRSEIYDETVKRGHLNEQYVIDVLRKKLRDYLKVNNALTSKDIYDELVKEDFYVFKFDGDKVFTQDGKGRDNPIDKSGTLNNIQIDKIMSKYNDYLGTIANDEIPTKILPFIKPQSRIAFIINTDNSNGPGKHWVSVFADGRPNGSHSIEYFDSFAEEPSDEVNDNIKQIAEKLDSDEYLKYKINKIVVQDDRTSNCGWFACKFIMDRMRGIPFRECTGYDASGQGEKDIEKFKNGYKKFDYIVTGQDGAGVKEWVMEKVDLIKQFFTGRTSSPELAKFIKKNGDQVITSMTVCRKPIDKMIRLALNIITLGLFDKVTSQMHYDNMFHLFLHFTTKSGSYITERNEVVRVYSGQKDGEQVPVPLNKQITVAEFFGRALQKEGEKLFQYHPVSNNCQDYVMTLLNVNGLNNATLSNFIKQDTVTLFKQLPGYSEDIANGLTQFAARLRILTGQGTKRK